MDRGRPCGLTEQEESKEKQGLAGRAVTISNNQ